MRKLSKQSVFDIVTDAISESIRQGGLPCVAHLAGNDVTEVLETVADQWFWDGNTVSGEFEGDWFCIVIA